MTRTSRTAEERLLIVKTVFGVNVTYKWKWIRRQGFRVCGNPSGHCVIIVCEFWGNAELCVRQYQRRCRTQANSKNRQNCKCVEEVVQDSPRKTKEFSFSYQIHCITSSGRRPTVIISGTWEMTSVQNSLAIILSTSQRKINVIPFRSRMATECWYSPCAHLVSVYQTSACQNIRKFR